MIVRIDDQIGLFINRQPLFEQLPDRSPVIVRCSKWSTAAIGEASLQGLPTRSQIDDSAGPLHEPAIFSSHDGTAPGCVDASSFGRQTQQNLGFQSAESSFALLGKNFWDRFAGSRFNQGIQIGKRAAHPLRQTPADG